MGKGKRKMEKEKAVFKGVGISYRRLGAMLLIFFIKKLDNYSKMIYSSIVKDSSPENYLENIF